MRMLKKILLEAAGMFLVLGLIGCGLKNSMGEENPSQQTLEPNSIKTEKNQGTFLAVPQEETTYSHDLETDFAEEKGNMEIEEKQETFLAEVVELEEQGIVVEPMKEEWEWNSSDRIRIGNKEVGSEEGMPELEVGDIVQIVYNGYVMETYPAQLGTVFAVYRQEKKDVGVKIAEYRYQHANIKLQLPEHWEYEIVPAEQQDGTDLNQSYGICFYPTEDAGMKLELLYWENGVGICGTGVTIEKVAFQNGMTATQYTETIDGMVWIMLVYQDLPGTYVVNGSVPEELWETYQPTVMEILESAELGKGNLEQKEAVRIAKEALTGWMSMPEDIYTEQKDSEDAGFYDSVRAVFQSEDGSWKVEFYNLAEWEKKQVVWVDKNGEILEELCEITRKE